jgi:anti-sigma regulatory factor (Ser/Thr protein kinase)
MANAIIGADIESIVKDLQPIGINQVVFEAITNSLQANAREIKVNFSQNSLDIPETDRYIDKIEIKDNGEGFNEINTSSFKTYRSTHKKHLGAKGIGRFLFLKLFEKVTVESLDKSISFSTSEDIIIKNREKVDFSKETKITLNKPHNTKVTINFEDFHQSLKDQFLPFFTLLEKKVLIKIFQNGTYLYTIDSTDIPKFIEDSFKVGQHDFKIDYVLNDGNIKNYDGFYCASGRVVVKNSELDSKIKLKAFKDVKIFYLISSEYLNQTATDERDDFRIKPLQRNSTLFNDLSWKNIMSALTQKIKDICKAENIDIDAIAKKHLLTSIQEMPFLGYYLRTDKNENALSSEALITQAKKAFDDDKKFLRANDSQRNEEYYLKLSTTTQTELAEYIFDRQKIIDKLKKLTDSNSIEKEIHNLFMKQKTRDDKENYKTNNLWLFDDRFMSYDKVFSDKQIKEIFPQLSENLDRPDILSIVSNTYQKEEITDIVIIELKRADDTISPARAEEQLVDYAGYINEAYEDRKIRIWTYAFLKFDAKTERSLKNKGYNRVLTKSQYPIYYHPFNEVNTIINFVDYNALADDANSRNKTFMKILKGQD